MDIEHFYFLCLQGNVIQYIEYIKEPKEIDKIDNDLICKAATELFMKNTRALMELGSYTAGII